MIATWTTRDGRRILLGALETDHLCRILFDLQRGRIRRPGCDGLSNGEWLLVLAVELYRRSRS